MSSTPFTPEQKAAAQKKLFSSTDRPLDVILLLNKGANPNSQDSYGITAFHYTTKPKIIEIFAMYGANLNIRDKEGYTPLHNMLGEYWEIPYSIKKLYELGADLEIKNNAGRTPLFEACHLKKWNIVSLLLELGADHTNKPSEGATDLIDEVAHMPEDAAGETKKADLLSTIENAMLIKRNWSEAKHAWMSAFARAQIHKHGPSGVISSRREIISPEARLAQLDLLRLCAKSPTEPSRLTAETLAECLSRGADINRVTFNTSKIKSYKGIEITDQKLYTPLTYVLTHSRNPAELDLLLGHPSINVNARGANLVPLALARTEEEALKLIQQGADVNLCCEEDGMSPLHLTNSPETIKILVAHGADLEAKDNDGWTPVSYFCELKFWEKLALLIALGANPNVQVHHPYPAHSAPIGRQLCTKDYVDKYMAPGPEKTALLAQIDNPEPRRAAIRAEMEALKETYRTAAIARIMDRTRALAAVDPGTSGGTTAAATTAFYLGGGAGGAGAAGAGGPAGAGETAETTVFDAGGGC
jgi:ankyrin repeat protein